jgi:predicted PhzF superfamily epimerase YddE/YHI9
MSVRVEVVRVFTDEAGEFGNELGIVSAADAKGREQQIAAELGFAETVFVEEPEGDRIAMRIFTPAVELPFAGHPSVGIAWWLAQAGTAVAALELAAGEVPVRYDGDTTWITGRGEWAPEFEWHLLDSEADVAALDPAAVTSGSHYFYAFVDEGAGRIRSRMFAPAMGITEDQATGAAAVALTSRLGRALDITQGIGSRIRTTALGGGLVELGGGTVWDREFTLG